MDKLGVPRGTLEIWLRRAKERNRYRNGNPHSARSLNLAEQLQAANKRIKELKGLSSKVLYWVCQVKCVSCFLRIENYVNLFIEKYHKFSYLRILS